MDERERHRRIGEIFLAVLDMTDTDERRRYLDRECADDASLRATVESLIAHDVGSVVEIEDDSDPLARGAVVGLYVIQRLLGAGAFGHVYLAERRGEFRKLVALKTLQPGVSSRHVVERFRIEKQVLAMMSHRNVATIHDDGVTEDGRHYFVTDFIPGLPITTYCDEHRLDVGRRLELFLQVCDGVLHAHQRGIVHRDLKPRNILVTDAGGEPSPKIIDFGIAKTLDRTPVDGRVQTMAGGIVGTPGYMSPEQWRGEPGAVDTRSDIYSLGVLLYELLCGEVPFGSEASYDEIRQAVLERDPERPSARAARLGAKPCDAAGYRACRDARALSRRIRGDLDGVVLKCLEKARERRYETAGALKADVLNHLLHLPVVARNQGLAYRFGKLARRHRQAFMAAGLLVAALGFAGLWYHARVLNREREATDLLQHARLLSYRYPSRALEELRRARALAPTIGDLAADEAYIDLRLGRREDAVRLVDGGLARDPDNGPALAIKAGLVREDEGSGAGDKVEARARALLPADKLYYLALGLRDDARAITLLTQAIEAAPGNAQAFWQRAERYYTMQNDVAALADAQTLVQLTSGLGLAWHLQGTCKLAVARARGDLDAVRGSIRDFTQALSKDPGFQPAYVNRAMAYRSLREYEPALRDSAKAIELDPKDKEAWGQRIAILFDAKGSAGADEGYGEAIRRNPDDPYFLRLRGDHCFKTGRPRDAIADYSRVIELVPETERGDALARRSVAYRYMGDYDHARADAEQAVALRPKWARGESVLGWALLLNDRVEASREHFARALALDPLATHRVAHGTVAWLAGDEAAAVDEYRRACEAPTFENACLWAWEIEFARGRKESAESFLRLAEQRANSAAEDRRRFVAALVAFLRTPPGQGAAIERRIATLYQDTSLKAEATYVFGCAAAARGRPTEARARFESCANLSAPGSLDRDLALVRLLPSPTRSF